MFATRAGASTYLVVAGSDDTPVRTQQQLFVGGVNDTQHVDGGNAHLSAGYDTHLSTHCDDGNAYKRGACNGRRG
jgi:hypothetical protein